MGQRLPERVSCVSLADHPLAAQAVDQPVALIGGEPMRLRGTVGQVEHHDQAEQNCREALADEYHCQPLSPQTPSIPRINPDSGAPITVEIGIAAMKRPTMRAR